MTHALVTAARQFANDESGRKRKRMSAEDRRELTAALNALEHQEHDPIDWARRGELAVALFDYQDDFAERAATVIADIIWAVQAHGLNPVDVIQQGWGYHLEDRPHAA